MMPKENQATWCNRRTKKQETTLGDDETELCTKSASDKVQLGNKELRPPKMELKMHPFGLGSISDTGNYRDTAFH